MFQNETHLKKDLKNLPMNSIRPVGRYLTGRMRRAGSVKIYKPGY